LEFGEGRMELGNNETRSKNFDFCQSRPSALTTKAPPESGQEKALRFSFVSRLNREEKELYTKIAKVLQN